MTSSKVLHLWRKHKLLLIIFISFYCVGAVLALLLAWDHSQLENQTNLQSKAYQSLTTDREELLSEYDLLQEQVASLSASLTSYQQRDEFVINQALEEEILKINQTYKEAVETYELLLKAKEEGVEREQLDNEFTKALVNLAERKYATAAGQLAFVQTEAQKEIDTIIEAREESLAKERANQASQVTSSNTPPSSGYSRQAVNSDAGTFTVDIVAADLGSTKVIVDTASQSDCDNECPVKSLGQYVAENGAFAGINGSYFCPASYPSCAGKTNSFDTLLMNKNKTYFNSDNNVYSTVPAVVFGSGWVRFVGQSLEWGRDTSIDSMIANQPLLVSGGNVVFGGDGDPKKGSKSNRSFVASRGNTIFIGVVRNATVAESARVLDAMEMDYALNLDAGGSTALWVDGYKAGPGRNIPNAILFVRK